MSAFRQQYDDCISADTIDICQLRQLAIAGVPEELKLRGRFWQVLLGYLPLETTRWADTLAEKRRAYQVPSPPGKKRRREKRRREEREKKARPSLAPHTCSG